MGFTEVLTICFIVLQLLGVIDWSWWLILLPEIIAVVAYVIWAIVAIIIFVKASKSIKKGMSKWE